MLPIEQVLACDEERRRTHTEESVENGPERIYQMERRVPMRHGQ